MSRLELAYSISRYDSFAGFGHPILLTRMARPLKPADIGARIPPGQFLTDKFPVLSYGPTPRFNPENGISAWSAWSRSRCTSTIEQFRALPQTKMVADFHCVTTWSRLDNAWEGVTVQDLMTLVKLDARCALRRSSIATAATPRTSRSHEFLDDDVMLAHRHDGRDLEPDHGLPLRLVVPKLYGWKSAKWVRAIEFIGSGPPRILGSARLP